MRVRQSRDPLIDRLPKPRQASAPFYYVLNHALGIDVAKLDTVNRMMRVVPEHSFALVSLLVAKPDIGGTQAETLPNSGVPPSREQHERARLWTRACARQP